jgi:hypothetical protein
MKLKEVDIVEAYIRLTEYVIRATDTEKFFLWKDIDRIRKQKFTEHRWQNIIWGHISEGRVYTIGKINNRPINIELSWAKLNGHYVTFWESNSELVDYKMLREWLEQTFKHVDIRHYCNALNFHLCIDYILEQPD